MITTEKDLICTFKIAIRYKYSMYFKNYLPKEIRSTINMILNSSYGITLNCENLFLCLEKQWFQTHLEILKIMIKYRLQHYYGNDKGEKIA